MGFFDWLKNIFATPPTATPPPLPQSQGPRPQGSPSKNLPSARPKSASLNLDIAQFRPAGIDETRAAAANTSLTAGPWFGRRDRIPPAADPRTKLIDRAMVGQGLLTPEDLVEIHAVGEEMDRVRPRLEDAAILAEQAMAATEAERQRTKERKKAESAERRRLRAEAVARRRATDIVFLGRGVSVGLADRRANIEKLASAGLPILATPADVAQAIDIAIPRLRWLAYHSEAATVSHYVRFAVPKRGGGVRQLAAPHQDLAEVQEWILRNILDKVPMHDAAHGFVRTRSTLSNARPHVAKAVVANADLKDFFPSITYPRVRGAFRELGYSPAVATILALLCTEAPRRAVTYAGKVFHVAAGPRQLPQGACTSPAISNLIARRMDARLTGITEKMGWRYTRYADDITFSSDNADAGKCVGYMLARLRHIAQDEGFVVNEAKTRVQRPSTAQTVTGIVVNAHPNVPRDTVRRIRAILHRAKTQGLAAQNRQSLPHFEAWLRGMIAYISMVNPAQGHPLREAYQALARQ